MHCVVVLGWLTTVVIAVAGRQESVFAEGACVNSAVVSAAQASAAPASPKLVLGGPQVVSTYQERYRFGFDFGYVDGVMGGVKASSGYQFFGSAKSGLSNCSLGGNTPRIQGVYPLTASADDPVQTFSAKCHALLSPSGRPGAYDRDYLGGGPAMRITDGTHHGILITYHSEFQYGGPRKPGYAPLFFGTLGMAISTDDGKTFEKLGQIIQPHPSRQRWIRDFPGTSLSVGNGPFVLGDEQRVPVDPGNADPEKTYLYVYYDDYDPCECAGEQCLAVARAKLADVIRSAFNHGRPAVSGLFKKYYQGKFEEPAATGDPENSIPSGRYTPLLQGAFSPSIVYEPVSQQAVLSTQAGKKGIEFRASGDLAQWSADPVAVLNESPEYTVRYPSLIEMLGSESGATPQLWLFYSHGQGSHPAWKETSFMARCIKVAK
jgi:hypothetical protein